MSSKKALITGPKLYFVMLLILCFPKGIPAKKLQVGIGLDSVTFTSALARLIHCLSLMGNLSLPVTAIDHKKLPTLFPVDWELLNKIAQCLFRCNVPEEEIMRALTVSPVAITSCVIEWVNVIDSVPDEVFSESDGTIYDHRDDKEKEVSE
ncbi:MAG: hypothetical protein WCO84_04945 [bacterium]